MDVVVVPLLKAEQRRNILAGLLYDMYRCTGKRILILRWRSEEITYLLVQGCICSQGGGLAPEHARMREAKIMPFEIMVR